MTEATEEYDYCIVGAGPAGCVLSHRLSEDARTRVLLLEAGPRDWHPFLHIPAACLFLYNDKRFNWMYPSEPQAHLGGRRLTLSQGKGLGGSSSINGMLHVRGQREDFDSWRDAGCPGWGYDDLLPYFERAESYRGAAGSGVGRGRDGLHVVSDFSGVHPLTRAFVEAARSLGSSENADINGPRREGVALYQQNRAVRFRSQPAQTYLRTAKRRSNLTVRTGAFCSRILFDGKRAIGAVYRRGERDHRVSVRREVILCAGTIRTPQLLQLSGIGAPELLRRQGIEVVQALDGVGEHLRDHFQVRVTQRLSGIATLNERSKGLPLLRQLALYGLKGSGLLTMGASTAAEFFRSHPESARADAQLMFAPGSFVRAGVLEDEPGMTIGTWASHPKSRGRVRIQSPDPLETPAIDPNFLADERDRAVVVACVRRARKVFASPAFAPWSVAETLPGAATETDDEIIAYAREAGDTGYHMVGTCRMGSGGDAVVGPDLRVRGLQALRIIDASVFPDHTVGNPNATIVAMAERAADLVRGRPPLDAEPSEMRSLAVP